MYCRRWIKVVERENASFVSIPRRESTRAVQREVVLSEDSPSSIRVGNRRAGREVSFSADTIMRIGEATPRRWEPDRIRGGTETRQLGLSLTRRNYCSPGCSRGGCLICKLVR